MKKTFLLPIASLLLPLMGCTVNVEDPTYTIEDMNGRTVLLGKKDFKRVVCIGAGALRMYSYVGDVNLLSGVEDIDNPNKIFMWQDVARPYYLVNKDVFAKLPSCGVGGPKNQAAEAEKILACNPDIVISEYEDVDAANALQEKLGVPVVTLKYGPKTVFDANVKESLSMLGFIFNREAKSEALVSYIDSIESELTSKTKDIKDADKPSIYVGCVGNWGQTNIYATSTTYPMFTVANIKNAVAGQVSGQGNQTIDPEKFQALKMDKIILDASGIANFKTTYQKEPALFDELEAVKKGEVYLQMPYNAYYTNLETAAIDAYYCAQVAYPTIFKDLDIAAKANEITEKFLGKACYSDILACGSSFGGFQKIDNLGSWLASH